MHRSIRKLLWKLGYDITKFRPASHPMARRKQLLESCAIDTVLDIGANSGQFARQLRDYLGYAGRILSFEPLSTAFRALRAIGKEAIEIRTLDSVFDEQGRRQPLHEGRHPGL